MSMQTTTEGRSWQKAVGVSTMTFFMFQAYQIDFFLHISARIPGLGLLRPTMLMFAIITFMLILQRDKIAARMQNPILKAFGAFIVLMIVTLPFVKYPGSVIRANIPLFLKAIVFLYFTALILDNEKRLKTAVFTFVACQVLRVLEPLYLNITQGYWGSSTWMGGGEFANRLSGAPYDIINPNELGFVIATAIPFLHFFLIDKKWIIKLFYFGLMALMLYALILTMSRGAFLALLIIGWIVFRDSKRKIMLVMFAVIIAMAGWSVMDSNQKDRYLSLVSSDAKQSGSADGRLEGIINEFKLSMERPIFGFGLGTTAEAKFNTWGHGKASHSMYAEVIIEVGLVGLFFFLKFIFTIYKQIKLIGLNENPKTEFEIRLLKSIKVVFWMFALYSLNYWGLSQYYWYNLAGITVALALLSGVPTAIGNRR